jgi:hypothetical protein
VRVAAFCDVHGTFPGLNAVLAEVDEFGVDAMIVGGDALTGPMPVRAFHSCTSPYRTCPSGGPGDATMNLSRRLDDVLAIGRTTFCKRVSSGPWRNRTSNLGIKSPGGIAATNCNELQLPATSPV